MSSLPQETNLESKTVNQLCFGKDGKKLCFHIPSYQRGYRWTSHVTKLLDDIYDFSESKMKKLNVGSYYCLQPIIVKHRPDLAISAENKQEEIVYEVVDGQQRLTTILILLTALSHRAEEDGIFRISYQRDIPPNAEREMFLKDIVSKTEADCKKADFFFIHRAYCDSKEWIKQKSEKLGFSPRQNILKVLLDEVKIIWYELPVKSDVHSHFRNINAGKIELTEAELIKAMMLNSKHYRIESTNPAENHAVIETTRLKQERIARVWDDCIRLLQDREFWGFINCDPRPRSKRMDFIIELYFKVLQEAGKVVNNTHMSSYFEQLLTDETSIQNTWDTIRELFRKIQDWFGDVSLYNYIGLLIHYHGAVKNKQNTLLDLIKESANHEKPEFCKWIINSFNGEIKVSNEQFRQMDFIEDKVKIKWMLMLFNIKLMNNLERRFDFAANGGWSVEHVFARESVMINEADRADWVKRHLRVAESRLLFSSETSRPEISQLLEKMRLYDKKNGFGELFSEYLRLIESPENEPDIIDNLALLGGSENSILQNDSFFDKRRKIIRMIEEGRNIPVGTERLFLKSFPNTVTSLDYWNKDDGRQYVDYMEKILFAEEENQHE